MLFQVYSKVIQVTYLFFRILFLIGCYRALESFASCTAGPCWFSVLCVSVHMLIQTMGRCVLVYCTHGIQDVMSPDS